MYQSWLLSYWPPTEALASSPAPASADLVRCRPRSEAVTFTVTEAPIVQLVAVSVCDE